MRASSNSITLSRRHLIVSACLIGLCSSPVDVLAKPARESRGIVIDDGVIPFSGGRASVGTPDAGALDAAANTLLAGVDGRILVVGHSADLGDLASRRIGRSRAKAVRAGLIERGVDASLIDVFSVGASETAAGASPSRVEVWQVPETAAAFVTWIKGSVKSAESEGLPPVEAELDGALSDGYRLEVDAGGAAELDLPRGRRAYVFARTKLVVRDTSKLSRRERGSAEDIELISGAIAVARWERRADPVNVKTPSALVIASSGNARVSVEDGDTIVSVYSGSARVVVGRKKIRVLNGHGVRIGAGGAISPARRMPLPAPWDMVGPAIVLGKDDSELYWKRAPGVERVEVQFARADDPNFQRPVRVGQVEANIAKLSKLPEGAYFVRLASVAKNGAVGAPGSKIKMVVFPQPQGAAAELIVTHGVVQLPGPGTFKQPAPKGMQIILGARSKPAGPEGITLMTPGAYKVPFMAKFESGTLFATGTISVEVASAEIMFSPVEASVDKDRSNAQVRFRVLGKSDVPIPGLRFRYVRVETPLPGLPRLDRLRSGERRGRLTRCKCEVPRISPKVTDEGEGYYSFVYSRAAGGQYRKDLVRVIDETTKLVQELEVPIGAVEEEEVYIRKSGLGLSVRVGGQLTDQDRFALRGDLEVGARIHLANVLNLDAGIQGTWFRSQVRVLDAAATSANLFPVQGRLAFVADFGGGGIYAGGSAGATIQLGDVVGTDPGQIDRAQFIWSAFIGGALSSGPGEVVFEVLTSPVTLTGIDAKANLGLGATLGYRWLPWKRVEDDSVDVGGVRGDEDFLDVEDNFD